MASVMTMLGRWAKKSSFTGALKSAADDTTANSEVSSWSKPGSSSDSTRGLPMASPVIITELTSSSSTRRQTSWGSNLAMSTIFDPTKLCPMTHHWVAPCINGAMGRWVMPAAGTLGHHHGRVGDAGVGRRVGAAPQGVEHVLVVPDHSLGHAGGATGVEDVEVLARPGAEVADLGLPGQRIFVGDGAGRRLDVGPVVDHHDVAQLGKLGQQCRDQRGELALVHDRLEIGVRQQVAQLVLDVAIVDVDPDRRGA